jgi:hypothetical protein
MATAAYAAATCPVDPDITRDVICNNLDHYADSFGQVRWAFSPGVSTFVTKSYLTPRTADVVVNTWYQITASAPFPLPLRADGSGYKLRVRLGGASSGGHAVKFALVIAPVAVAPAVLAASNTDASFETATTTSASAAWLTGASQGIGAYTTMVALDAATAAGYVRNVDTPVDLSGAASAVSQCLVSVVVYGSTANTGSVPRLYGGFAAEWVG